MNADQLRASPARRRRSGRPRSPGPRRRPRPRPGRRRSRRRPRSMVSNVPVLTARRRTRSTSQQPLDVLRRLTSTSRFTGSPTARRGRAWCGARVVGISADRERSRSADVDRPVRRYPSTVDRALLDQVAGQRRAGLTRSRTTSRPSAGGRSEGADAVDVTLHDVPAEPGRRGHRALQVDLVAGASAPRSCGRSVSAITSTVNVSLIAVDHGQTDAVDRDRVAVTRRRW